MTIPKYDEIMPYALQSLKEDEMQSARSLEPLLAEKFNLTENEIAKKYESGNGAIFLDRIGWALSFLTLAGLAYRPKRGLYNITDQGKQFIDKPNALKTFVKSEIAKRETIRKQETIETAASSVEQIDLSEVTPQEALNQAYENIQTSVYDLILDTILSKKPYEFEKLVVNLLDKMGYGGQLADSATVTQPTNDGGIDGIIKEDVLGLGKIHIQAKRYARGNRVGREEVQKFVGALAVAESNKGVFITTSYFSDGAIEYAKNLHGSTNLVLIDGQKLAEYIYEYGLGMQVEQSIEIKKLDADFWDEMQDDDNIK